MAISNSPEQLVILLAIKAGRCSLEVWRGAFPSLAGPALPLAAADQWVVTRTLDAAEKAAQRAAAEAQTV